MIKLQDMTPEVYYMQSRDFQLIGRLYDLVLNYTKTNVDCLKTSMLGQSTDSNLVDLLAMTLGFKSKHNYNIKQLIAICSIFSVLLKNKGSLYAVNLAGKALLNAEGATENFECSLQENTLTMCIPDTLTDINLLKDLLNYIIPAGVTCNIIKAINITEPAQTAIGASDTVQTTVTKDSEKSIISHKEAFVDSTVIRVAELNTKTAASTSEASIAEENGDEI